MSAPIAGVHMGGRPYRKVAFGFYRPFTRDQRDVVEFFVEEWEIDAVKRLVGDREYVIPRGGLLYSRSCVARLLNVCEGTVKRSTEALEELGLVHVYNAHSKRKPPRVHQEARHAGDRSGDRQRDRYYSTDHRVSPSLLVWRNLFETFGVEGDSPQLNDRSADRRQDRDGDRSDRQKLLQVV